jgi:hypothetical protein
MKALKKIIGSGMLTAFLALCFAPAVMAQSALEDIRARLEEEGITVVDYSTPEGAWGSLPSEWVQFLSGSYDNLGELAADFDDLFTGNGLGEGSLTNLRRQLAIAVAEKSGLTLQSDIDAKDAEIEALLLEERNSNGDLIRTGAIPDLENAAKDRIAEIISSAPPNLNKETGINLIFQEIDFYYNYNKWGRLPIRIIGVLETSFCPTQDNCTYSSLQDMVNAHDLSTESGVESLRNELLGAGLNEDDTDLVLNSTQILLSPGEAQINLVGRAIANTIKNLAGALAVIWIVYAGIRLIFAQGDESVITEQKKSLTYAIIGLMGILLVDRLIDVLYGAPGVIRTELVEDQGFTNEVYGVINFIKALIGSVAIFFVVMGGVRMLFAQGQEDQITEQRKSLLWIGAALILVAIDQLIVEQLFIIPTQQSDQISSTNVQTLINTLGTVLQFLLGFVGLIAFAALIYGAATMIMNYGNDEMVEKSKKVIRNAVIGILVILSAYVVVATLVVFR